MHIVMFINAIKTWNTVCPLWWICISNGAYSNTNQLKSSDLGQKTQTRYLDDFFFFFLLCKPWFHGKLCFDLNECNHFYVASISIGSLLFLKRLYLLCVSRGMCIPPSFNVFCVCVFVVQTKFSKFWGDQFVQWMLDVFCSDYSSLKIQSFHFKPRSNSILTFYDLSAFIR